MISPIFLIGRWRSKNIGFLFETYSLSFDESAAVVDNVFFEVLNICFALGLVNGIILLSRRSSGPYNGLCVV